MSKKTPPIFSEKNDLNTSPAHSGKIMGIRRDNDISLSWVQREYPQLIQWRLLAVEWMKGETKGIGERLFSLVIFLEKYIVKYGLPLDPAIFLNMKTSLPDFYQNACPETEAGIGYNNTINSFLSFVLHHEFSTHDDSGHRIIMTGYHNPVRPRSKAGIPKLDESVRSPLPYGYIDELRQILAPGRNFCDWQWAQHELGARIGGSGNPAADWFSVTEDMIDRNDPDCVWRLRQRGKRRGGTILEMWSPVRWVALLAKLLLPLRTFQVRMLDSGEADTWRYDSGKWVLNTHPLAGGTERRPLRQGVFRNAVSLSGERSTLLIFYINTNKTQDIAKYGADKGYELPWAHPELLYWMERLRNWQEKYNPIRRRTAWIELDARHIPAKSDVQLAGYPDACFLFRLPEGRIGEQHLPVTDIHLRNSWHRLLGFLQSRLAARGETHSNGEPICLLPPEQQKLSYTTLFPLHSLRVSLMTALALEGQVPFPILQKLVGHSRLLMTLYYIKPGVTHVRDVLTGAAERLDLHKEASIQNFLLHTEYNQLINKAVCNSAPSLAAAIPQHPAARNPAGWMPMHHGLCLVGGNTNGVEGYSSFDGCHNGGPQIGPVSDQRFGPVPGGSRNCVRCRWFITEPHFLPALAAHFNSLAYRFDEARNACIAHEECLIELKKEKAEAEEAGQPYVRLATYRQAERVWETAIKNFNDLAEDLVACYRLMERCQKAINTLEDTDNSTRLITAGTVSDVQIIFEETESELLQLSGICEDVEIYPDLEPGKAVFRRSQLLDGVLYREHLPPVFILLSEQEQLRAGNTFMRQLAKQMNATNPALGQREVVQLIDAGEKLSEYFGMDFAALVPTVNSAKLLHVAPKKLMISGDAK